MSINDSMEKIKQFMISEMGKDILIVMIIVLVGLGSFQLGRLSKENSSDIERVESSASRK